MMRLEGELIRQYRKMHAGRVYRGGSTLRKHVADIAKLVAEIPTETILDYGCGKGMQYIEDGLHEAWGIMPTLFDPGVPEIDELPDGTFDGVICTGVLEHVPRREIDDAISNLVRYAGKWAFISIGCSPSNKRLPNGRDVHVTLKPEEWWLDKLHAAFGDRVRLETSFIWR
jgi:hypothetical protein